MIGKNLSWDDIELFLYAARLGSLGKAGAALGLTQPTVGRRLQKLEETLEVKLFSRTPEGLQLSSAGSAVFATAEQMERSANQFLRTARTVERAVEGSVGVSAPDGLSAFWIVPRLPQLIQAYPKLQLSFDCGLWPRQGNTLLADVAILSTEPQDLNAIRVPLCWLHYSFFASTGYLNQFGRPKHLRDLVTHRLIGHTGANGNADDWYAESRAVAALSSQSLITNSSAASLMAVREGVGITPLPTLSAELFPDLEPLPLGSCGSIRLYLCYSEVASGTPKIRAVIDWLKDMFDPKKSIWLQEEFVDPIDARRLAEADRPAGLRLVKRPGDTGA
jgi:DNA-binding transcriptional LysR family regulator